jgi:HK97 family phage major capsid protein
MQSTWLMTDGARKLVDELKDGNGRYLWTDPIKEGTDGTLLGRPVVIVDEIPENLGAGTNETEIWFVYGQNYVIGDRAGMRIETGTSGDDFQRDKISMRVIRRVGGIPIIGESFTKITGVK